MTREVEEEDIAKDLRLSQPEIGAALPCLAMVPLPLPPPLQTRGPWRR